MLRVGYLRGWPKMQFFFFCVFWFFLNERKQAPPVCPKPNAPTPLQSLAGITCPDAQTVMVQPFDAGAMKEIEKAIIESDTGFTPNNDGKVLRINVPALTAERRKEMAKMCGKMGEEGKIALRNVRRDCMALVKEKEAGEDETRAMEAEVEKAAADYGKKVDKLVKDKEKEITSL